MRPCLVVEHIVYDAAVDVSLKQLVRLLYHEVASLKTVFVGKLGEFLHRVLLNEICRQFLHFGELIHFLTVVVGVVECKLQNKSRHRSLLVVRSDIGGVLGDKNVGSDASASIHNSSD